MGSFVCRLSVPCPYHINCATIIGNAVTGTYSGSRNKWWKSTCARKIGDISTTGHPIHLMFGSRVGFCGRRIKWRYFHFDQIQDGRRSLSWKLFKWPYLSNGSSDPFRVGSRWGFRGRRILGIPTSVWSKSKRRPRVIFKNFDWIIYLWNGISNHFHAA